MARPATSKERKIARVNAPSPEIEHPREGAFGYSGESDGQKRYADYEREARYAGRDADSEGRYGIPGQQEIVRKEFAGHRQHELKRRK